jgi:multidrug transporter EmrE-like cation transporter
MTGWSKKTLIEIFGWYGTAAIILAYALVGFSVVEPTTISYQVLNGTGALGVALVSFYKRTYQPGVLNVVWIIIAIMAMMNVAR